jgi:hypothetical protein
LTKNIIETRATRVLPGRLKEVLGKASAAASSWNDVATEISDAVIGNEPRASTETEPS